MVDEKKTTLEKIIDSANALVGQHTFYMDTMSRATHKVIHNASYGAQLFELKYVYFRRGKFVPRCRDLPVPSEVAARYVAKKIMAENINFPRAKNLIDEHCSIQSARHGLMYLRDIGAIKMHHISRQMSTITYIVTDEEKIKQIAEGEFT